MRWRGGSGGAMTTHTVGPPRAGRQLHSQPPRGSPSGTSSDDGLVMAGTLALPAGNGPHAAVVLLCPGRLDREGDVGKARICLGRALATALAARGWRPSASTAAASVTRRGDWRATGFFQHRQDVAAVLRALAVRLVLRLLGRTAQGLSGREAWCATSHVTPPGRATTA